MNDRLEAACKIVKSENVDVEPDEIIQISEDIGESDLKKVAKVTTYVRKRFIENMSRYDAFRISFPERCIVTDTDNVEKWGGSKNIGEPLSRSAIEIKAKRLENSKIYKSIVALLNTSLYVAYAIDRMKVLDYTLEKIFDENVSDRNKVEYIKTFLQETRKPDKAKELEVNVNVQQNNVSVNDVEEKLNGIANKLEGLTAKQIISITSGGSNDN